jgi:hypothetical protein
VLPAADTGVFIDEASPFGPSVLPPEDFTRMEPQKVTLLSPPGGTERDDTKSHTENILRHFPSDVPSDEKISDLIEPGRTDFDKGSFFTDSGVEQFEATTDFDNIPPLRGPVGLPGPKGDTGRIGIRGMTGHRGLPGFRGIKGGRGFQGPQGFRGEAGPPGPVRQVVGFPGVNGTKV